MEKNLNNFISCNSVSIRNKLIKDLTSASSYKLPRPAVKVMN